MARLRCYVVRAMAERARHVCPICAKEAAPRRAMQTGGGSEPRAVGNASFPFCSPACKLVDLGRWLDGSYRVPGPPVWARDGDDEAEDRE